MEDTTLPCTCGISLIVTVTGEPPARAVVAAYHDTNKFFTTWFTEHDIEDIDAQVEYLASAINLFLFMRAGPGHEIKGWKK